MDDQPEQPGASWLTTFSDLMFLLLTFFVLKFAMIGPNYADTDGAAGERAPSGRYALELAEADFTRELQRSLGGTPARNGTTTKLANDITLTSGPSGLVVRIAGAFLAADPTDLTFRASEAVRLLSEIALERGLAIGVTASASVSLPTPPPIRELLFQTIRQIVDTGLPLGRISGTGSFHAFTQNNDGYLLELTLTRSGLEEFRPGLSSDSLAK